MKLIVEVLVDQDDNGGDALDHVYERFEASDTATAEERSAGILFGLGFDNAMQPKKTREPTVIEFSSQTSALNYLHPFYILS